VQLIRPTRRHAPHRSAFAGFRFPAEVIVLAVRWYLRFGLSYRDVEELLAERGIDVDHVTVHRWVRRFTPLLADAARFGRHRVGDRWFVDETYVKVAGRWVYLYRAVDQYGQVIDVYASTRRDSEAARRFFQRARTSTGVAPSEVVTDRAPAYPRVLDQLLPAAWHHIERHANNRVEADHAQLKRRLRPMRGINTMAGLRVLAAGHAFVQNLMGTWQATAAGSPQASPSRRRRSRGLPAHAYPEQCTRMPWRRSAGSGAHGGGGWCRVTRRHHLGPRSHG
jgi:transposase-like protein